MLLDFDDLLNNETRYGHLGMKYKEGRDDRVEKWYDRVKLFP